MRQPQPRYVCADCGQLLVEVPVHRWEPRRWAPCGRCGSHRMERLEALDYIIQRSIAAVDRLRGWEATWEDIQREVEDALPAHWLRHLRWRPHLRAEDEQLAPLRERLHHALYGKPKEESS